LSTKASQIGLFCRAAKMSYESIALCSATQGQFLELRPKAHFIMLNRAAKYFGIAIKSSAFSRTAKKI
jgi:hypothetical protein